MSIVKHAGLAAALAGTALAVAPATGSALPPPNIPPHAEIAANPNPAVIGRLPGFPPLSGARVTLDASGSYDLGGSIVKYEWDADGNGTYEADTGANPRRTVTYTTPGTRNARVRVTDNAGVRRSADVAVVVHRRPVARVTATPAAALIGESVVISGATSTDDGSIVKYQFDLDNDGTFETNNGASPSLTRSYGSVGTRTIRIRVTDNYGVTDDETLSFVVHRTPTAALDVAPSPAVAGRPVTFDGSGSTDDAPLVRYEFDLDGDGAYEVSSASPTATRTYANPGTVSVRMRVVDAHGVTDVTTRSLVVDEAPLTPRDTIGPAITIASSSARASRAGVVKVKVKCPTGETAGCAGKVKLSKLGSATFSIAAGKTKTLKVQLSAKKLRRLKRAGSVVSKATVKATDAAGNVGTATKELTVSRPKR